MFNIDFNGHTPESYNAWLATIPVLTHSEINQTRLSVPGRDGELLVDDATRGNAIWACMVHMKRDDYAAKMRQVQRWLSGSGTLKIKAKASDSFDAYFEVIQTTFTADVRRNAEYGRLSVSFECYPYEFLISGDSWITNYGTIENPGDVCMPVYEITGSGDGVLTVNDKPMSFTATSKLTIDTRRQIAYKTVSNVDSDANNDISGDYTNLYLKNGNNFVTITNGFTLRVKPRWGYII